MMRFLEYLKLTLFKFFHYSGGNKIKLAGYNVHFGNIGQLKLLYKEIFLKENYKCPLPVSPYIIDGGANIGLAVLYFKKHFPGARIIAFEPNPDSFTLLKKNIESNNIEGVELYASALSDHSGSLSFYTSSDMAAADVGASAIKGHVDHYHSEKGNIIEVKVPCMALSPFITQKVDLLKLDIEGSEGLVIKEITNEFNLIENLMMEYHYQADNADNNLSEILKVLEDNNHVSLITSIGNQEELRKVNSYFIKSRKN